MHDRDRSELTLVSRAERRVGAQLLSRAGVHLQSVLPTDRRLSLNFYARLSNHDNARICRVYERCLAVWVVNSWEDLQCGCHSSSG